MKTAIEMNIMKDMANMKREVDELKGDLSKNTFKTKQDILN